MNKRRLITSLLTIVVAAVVVLGATRAFFSDTETSTGNTFTAGAIDLKVDNTSYVTDANGVLVASPATSWTLDDLTNQLFFNFLDLKPGDIGEDTISLHVNDNNAWVCAAARVTADIDNTYSEPELEVDTTIGDPSVTDGELAENLNFTFWADDGDNVLETDEVSKIFVQGPASGLNGLGQIALADSATNVWAGTANTPVLGASTVYVGKAWCFGTLTNAPVAQDGQTTNGPLSGGASPRGTGFTCNGANSLNNAAQTDLVHGDIQFYAVQSRNNPNFTCGQNYTPVWPSSTPQPEVKVGAALGDYVAPTACNVTVDDTGGDPALDTIQEGVNAATDGQTVCVKAGTYTEDVNVNKSLTLAGDGASLVTLTGVGTGEAGAIVVTADNVTVKGFKVIGTGVSALRISNPRSGVTFSYNHAVAATGNNALLMDGGQSNHTVSNNLFEGASSQLAYVNGLASVNVASTNVDFLNNTFGGSATMALGQEAGGSDVKLNKFSAVTSFTDIEDWEGGNVYNQNNFNDAGLNLQHSENGNTGDNGITNAENNWWGDIDASDGDVSPNVDVDFDPEALVAFPEN